jgi:hypothetical protein
MIGHPEKPLQKNTNLLIQYIFSLISLIFTELCLLMRFKP